MKTAVVYYSMTGNTALAAGRIAQLLDADLIPVEPVRRYPDKGIGKFLWGGKSAVFGDKPQLLPYGFRADRYEQIILGFPVWAGRPAPPLCTFVSENLEALKAMRLAAFACQSGSGAQKAFVYLAKQLGIEGFERQLVLIDPKDRPKDDTESRIEAFCAHCG